MKIKNDSNSSCYYLLKALHNALVEIREEAYEIKNGRIYGLSNLLHNLPLQINSVISDNNVEADCSILLQSLIEKAEKAGAEKWINNIIEDSSLPGTDQ